MQNEELFHNYTEHNTSFEELNDGKIKKAQAGMWAVDDRVHENPNLRFQREHNSFAEMIYEHGSGTIMGGVTVPKGMIKFLEERFLKPFNTSHSHFVSVKEVAEKCFEYLDIQEPYFFIVDMPVSLTAENYEYTYKLKNGSILNPADIETFEIKRGWKFPHYMHAHRIITDHRTAAISRGEYVPKPPDPKNPHAPQEAMTEFDILEHVCRVVFGDYSYVEGMVEQWANDFYENLIWSHKTSDPEVCDAIRSAQDHDFKFWLTIAIGVFTWLKSPHGLKFLTEYHPIYYELLDWDHDSNTPRVRSGVEGWAIVNSWTIYTSRDVERLPGVPPGTCCVSKQHLHCTERVNAHAVKARNCYCGDSLDYTAEDYYASKHSNPIKREECKRWWKDQPEAQMVFISYAAMYNLINNLDPNTRCQRHSCPNTKCSYHAGNYARVRALTEQRTKLLTATKPH